MGKVVETVELNFIEDSGADCGRSSSLGSTRAVQGEALVEGGGFGGRSLPEAEVLLLGTYSYLVLATFTLIVHKSLYVS